MTRSKRSGRPKLPTMLKLVRGTIRAGRENPHEAVPPSAPSCPEPPEFLGELAKQEWRTRAPGLYQIGLLTDADIPAFAAFCEAVGDFIEATKNCATVDGRDRKVLLSKDGNQIYESPFFSIKKRAMELILKFGSEFGMTPASRSGIEAGPPEPHNPPSRWKSFPGA